MDEIISPETNCCVHGCNSKFSFKNIKKCKFFEFPSIDINVQGIVGRDLFFKWIHAVKLPSKYTPVMRVCSLHFTEDDYFEKDGKKILKFEAVPSKNLPKVWRNKFYPRNYGRLIKFLEYRGIGRLRLCLQAKLVRRLKRRTAAINEHRKKTKRMLQKTINSNDTGLQVSKAFTLTKEGSLTPHHDPSDLLSEIAIKEEPLSPGEVNSNIDHEIEDTDYSNDVTIEQPQKDTVEEMLAKMNEDTPPTNNNNRKPVLDDSGDEDFCNICGSDACTGHGGLQFDCNLCNKTFRTYRQLNAHNLSHFEKKRYGEGGMSKCKVCGQVVPDSTGLTEHMLQHGGSNAHVCMLCEKAFNSRQSLMVHVNVRHTLDRVERCKLCSKVCTSRKELDQHVKSHKLLRKEFSCRECGLTFRSKAACWAHLNRHTRERSREGHRCEVCSRVLSTRNTLREHMTIHSGEKPFECLLCGKKIRHRANFIIHVQSHSLGGAGLHPCVSCGASYARKSELNAHIASVHPQDASYPCIICGMLFRSEARFLKHAITHNASLDEP